MLSYSVIQYYDVNTIGARPVVLSISTPARRRLRVPGDSTVGQLLEAEGLRLGLRNRLLGRRLVVRNNRTQVEM